MVNSSVWLMATLSAVSKCSGLLHWGGGGRWQESGGLLGLKYWFCRHGLEWCEQPEKIQQITKAKKAKKEATMEQNTDVEILILKQKR